MTTAQEIFTQVWNHFVVNEAPRSMDSEGRCWYRGPEGQRCAVGVVLLDTEYVPEHESHSVGTVCAKGFWERLCPHTSLLRSLQRLHDSAMSDTELQADLRAFARGNVYGVVAPAA